jgi:ubiquitin fusion degradation protein 1
MFDFVSGIFGPKFQKEYKCYSFSSIQRDELEAGNRLILPPSAVRELSRQHSDGPMLFEVTDLDQRLRTHAGVLEFTAQEDVCFMPQWMLRRLVAEEGHMLRVALKTLPKATFVRLRPASVALLRIYNPKAMLESGLKGFVALTAGDEFAVPYNKQLYHVEVVEVRPGDAVSIVDTDVEVDFATPKDAQPQPPPAAQTSSPEVGAEVDTTSGEVGKTGLTLFSGTGQRPNGAAVLPEDHDAESEEELPWKSKRRIPYGVKYTTPPYGYRSLGEAPRGSNLVAEKPAVKLEETAALGGSYIGAASPDELKAHALFAASQREADQAVVIAHRRREEEEKHRREEEERKRREAEEQKRLEAEKARRRLPPVQQAPAQKRMVPAAGGESAASGGPGKPSTGLGCCGCFRAGPSEPDKNLPSTKV